MSVIEAMSRIDQIQSSLLQLSGVRGTVGPAGAANVPADGSTDFARALSAALGTNASNPSTDAIPNPGAATGNDVAAAAKKYLGVPYVFGGEDGSGMDCSGLVQRVYADLGIDMPRLVSGQMKVGTEVASLAEAQPGDLIVTGGGDHILIYAGDNKVIHAPYEGRTVSLVDAYMSESDITTIRRIIPTGAAPASLHTSALGQRSSGDLVASALMAAVTAQTRSVAS